MCHLGHQPEQDTKAQGVGGPAQPTAPLTAHAFGPAPSRHQRTCQAQGYEDRSPKGQDCPWAKPGEPKVTHKLNVTQEAGRQDAEGTQRGHGGNVQGHGGDAGQVVQQNQCPDPAACPGSCGLRGGGWHAS